MVLLKAPMRLGFAGPVGRGGAGRRYSTPGAARIFGRIFPDSTFPELSHATKQQDPPSASTQGGSGSSELTAIATRQSHEIVERHPLGQGLP